MVPRIAMAVLVVAAGFHGPVLAGDGGGEAPPPAWFPDPPKKCDPVGKVRWRPLKKSIDSDIRQLEPFAETTRHVIYPVAKYAIGKIPGEDEVELIKDIIFGCQ